MTDAIARSQDDWLDDATERRRRHEGPKANGGGKDSESAAPFVLFDKIDNSPKEWLVKN